MSIFKLDEQEKLRYRSTGWTVCLRTDAVYIVTKSGYRLALIQKFLKSDKPAEEYLAEVNC